MDLLPPFLGLGAVFTDQLLWRPATSSRLPLPFARHGGNVTPGFALIP